MFSKPTQDSSSGHDNRNAQTTPRSGAPLGALPSQSRLVNIETALRNLEPHGEVYVDTQGNVHKQKAPFVSGQALPLASFRSRADGAISVFAGVPPHNPTYCAAGHATSQDLLRNPLQYNTVLRSGDWLGLGPACTFRVPAVIPDAAKTGEEQLQYLLATAAVGDVVSLGRAKANSLDGSVSRVHITVEILEKRCDAQGMVHLEIRVMPGLPSKQPIWVDAGKAEPWEVQGQRTIAPGMKVTLGDLGFVQVPYKEGTIQDLSQSMSNLVAAGKKEEAQFLFTCMSQRGRLEYSELKVKEERRTIENPELAIQANLLQNQICRGLELIKEGKCGEAVALFRNPATLEMLGYRFEENHLWELPEISVAAIRKNLQGVASDSWFLRDQKRVYPSFGELRSGVQPQDDSERDLLSRWEKEVALIYAEEYTHALQDLLQSNVSRKAVLFPSWQTEADVAVFFHEQGIPLSYEFVQNRYPEREIALRIVRGYQMPEEQAAFSEALHQTPIGERLYIGRATERQEPERRGFSIPQLLSVEDDMDIQAAQERASARAPLGGVEAVIERSQDGTYTISPYSATGACRIFVPDASGYYSQLVAPVRLEPGTPFYIGQGFKFVLE